MGTIQYVSHVCVCLRPGNGREGPGARTYLLYPCLNRPAFGAFGMLRDMMSSLCRHQTLFSVSWIVRDRGGCFGGAVDVFYVG